MMDAGELIGSIVKQLVNALENGDFDLILKLNSFLYKYSLEELIEMETLYKYARNQDCLKGTDDGR